MPIKGKIFAIILFAAVAGGVSAQNAEFTGYLDSFLGDINKSLPDTSVAGGTWSDGYIGQLISLPPHLGLGVSCAVSRFPLASLTSAASAAGASIDIPDALRLGGGFLINPAIELRIGGFVLPFDLGVRFSMLASDEWYDINLEYYTFSVDLRYAVIEENVALPAIVLGIGWYHTSGSIGYGFSLDELDVAGFDIAEMTGSKNLGIDFKTNVFELRAQVSKRLLVFTPYIGLTGYFAMSESSYEIAGVENTRKDNHFGSRVYGGLSFNIFMVKIDVSASYNFVTQNWGGNLGARFQL